MNPNVIATGATILAVMWGIHKLQGEKIAWPDLAGVTAGTVLASWWTTQMRAAVGAAVNGAAIGMSRPIGFGAF